jgi:8-hydroxy-5-deazaflavin:NADPH oxidoreductase
MGNYRMKHIDFARRAFMLSAIVICVAGIAIPIAPAQSQDKSLKIGIIGSGRVGGELGRLWANAGYKVMLSAADIGPVRELAAQIGQNAQAGTPAQAAAYGDVVVISVPYSALPQIGRDYATELKGKVILDTCNPVLERDGDMAKEALDKGTGVIDPTYLPGTRLVRAFITINYKSSASEAHRPGEQLGVPLAADDKQALLIASQLVHDAGFEPVVVGDLSTAKSFDIGQRGSKVHSAGELRSILGL